MMEIVPPVESNRRQAVDSILENLAGADLTLPAAVIIEDEDGVWRRFAADRTVEDRRRSVIVVSTGAGLVDAVRFEIGGALWLPVSTPSMEVACEAAVGGAHQDPAPMATDGVLELAVSHATELRAVAWLPRSFWNRQLGVPVLIARLAAVATRLRCPPVILERPALLVPDRSRAEIESALREISDAGSNVGCGSPVVTDVSDLIGSSEPRVDIVKRLVELERVQVAAPVSEVPPQPVHELPSGVRVGCWASALDGDPEGPGWIAVPGETTSLGHFWQMGTGRADYETIVDSVEIRASQNRSEPILRVPGWIAAGIRRGTPSGLLVERMARDPARDGRPLWVPNVDLESVQYLLSLPGPIWVDGPAVPK